METQQESSGRGLLREQAYREVKRLLMSDRLGEEKLSERKLAKRLGMSNTPVRSAIERLETEGLITISPQRGIVVREPSPREVRNHLEIRFAIESHVIRTVAGHLTAAQVEKLEAELAAQSEVAVGSDIDDFLRFYELDMRFHLGYVGFLGNEELDRIMNGWREKIFRRVREAYSFDPRYRERAIEDHTALVAALKSGDSDAGVRALRRHMDYGCSQLRDSEPTE